MVKFSPLLDETGIPMDTGAFATSGALLTQTASVATLSVRNCGQILRLVVFISVMAGLASLSSSARCWAGADSLKTPAPTRYGEQSNGKPLAIGFYVNWDFRSYASLRSNIRSLDWVVPSWLYLRGEAMDLKTSLDFEALDLMRTEKPEIGILAMIQNASAGEWDGINLGRLLANPVLRRERIQEIASFIETYHLQGIVIDFEQIPGNAQKDMINFLTELQATFKEKGWLVSVAVPFDDPSYDYAAYAKACDYLILMAYDEHWLTGGSGPIASHAWFSSHLATRLRDIAPSQMIIAIGNYGYDWASGEKAAQALTYPEVMQRSIEMGSTAELDPSSLNPGFSYNHDGKAHRVWFLDADSAFYQLQTADSYRPAGYALWRLGGEDPAMWSVLPHSYDDLPPLSVVKRAKDVSFRGAFD